MAVTVNDLRTKRVAVWNSAKAFLDSHRTEGGVLSAEDDATYSRMEKEMTDLGKEIARLERLEAMDREMAKPTSTPILAEPMMEAKRTGRASKEYMEDFVNHLKGRALVHNVLSTTPGSDGGYLVPEEFEHQIVQQLDEENVIRSLAKVITTQHDRKIPVAANHSTAQWTAENAAYTESNPTFAQKQIDAYKLTDLAKVSVELLQDSAFDIEDYLASEFSRAFGIAEEQAFCVGTGTGQPTGIFTANGGTIGVTTASSTAITLDEVISLVHALKSPYRRNAKFLMNDATIAMIRKLKDNNGAYIWQPSAQAGVPDRLLGYEIYTSPYVPTVAAEALVMAFGDFSSYWIADRMGRSVQRLNELYAGNGQVGFIATERVDAKVILAEGIQLLKMKE